MALTRDGFRRVLIVGIPLVIVGILALVSGQLPFAVWRGYNGDHYYYGSMALQFTGSSYDDSLQEVASYFHYTLPPSQMDRGYLNPLVSPLIYPRTALPLLAAPFVAMFGLGGLYVPGIVCGVLTAGILIVFCLRRFGWVAALAVSVLMACCAMVTEMGFGIYTEALVILVVTLLLLVLPLDGVRRSWRHAATVGVLVAVLVFVRQVVIFPLAIVAFGWLQAWWRTRSFRNAWFPFVLVVVLVAWVSGVVVNQWAPYNPFLFLAAVLHVQVLQEMLPLLPQRFWAAMATDTATAWQGDRLRLVLPLLAVVGGIRLRATAWPWVTMGAFVAGLVTTALNGTPNGFRYLAPALPLVLVLAAVGVSELSRGVVGQVLRERTDGYQTRPPGVGGVRRTSVALAGAMLALAVTVVATIVVYRPAPLDSAARRIVSQQEFGADWPIVDTAGTLLCAGDDAQVWFRSQDGQLYAFSGTAMARSLTVPRLFSRARETPTYGWRKGSVLLNAGIDLCRKR